MRHPKITQSLTYPLSFVSFAPSPSGCFWRHDPCPVLAGSWPAHLFCLPWYPKGRYEARLPVSWSLGWAGQACCLSVHQISLGGSLYWSLLVETTSLQCTVEGKSCEPQKHCPPPGVGEKKCLKIIAWWKCALSPKLNELEESIWGREDDQS